LLKEGSSIAFSCDGGSNLDHCHFFFHRAYASVMALSLAIIALDRCVCHAVLGTRDRGCIL
jgi:hypothetical protein